MRVLPFVFVAASFGATACVTSYEVNVQSKGVIVARWPWLPCTGDAAPHCRAAFYRWQDTHKVTDARDEMREAVRVAETADPISRALVYYDLAVVLRQMGDLATARLSIAFATKLHPDPSYDALRSDLAAQGAAAPLPENDGFYAPIAVALGEKPSVAAPTPSTTTTPSATTTPSVPTTMTAGGQTFPWVCHGKVTLDGVQVKITGKQLIEVSEDCDLTITNSTLELVYDTGVTIGVRKGALTVKNSTLRMTGTHGYVVDAAGAKLAFEDSTIDGTDTDATAVRLVDTFDSNHTPTVADFKKTTLHGAREANGGSALSASHSKVTATGLTVDGSIGCSQKGTMKLEKMVATNLSVSDCAVDAVDATIDMGKHASISAGVTVFGGSLKANRLAVTGTNISSQGLRCDHGTVDLEDATIAVQGEALSATVDSKIVLTRGTFTGFGFSAVSIRTGSTLDAKDAHIVTDLKVGLALYVLNKSPATNAPPSAHLNSCTLEGHDGLLADNGGTITADDTTVKAVSEGATVRGSSSITMTRGSVSADYAAVLAKSGTIVLKKTKITGPTKSDGGTITGP